MGGRHSRNKGANFEREIVNKYKAMGVDAKRVPLSGAMKNGYEGDVILHGMTVECKIRKDGFKELYKWLEHDDAEFLAIRADRKKTLYVLPEETFIKFLEWAKIKEA